MSDYLQRFKMTTDKLAASNSPVSDDDLQVCILNGLSSNYQSFASSIRTSSTSVNIEELHSLLVAEELCLLDESSSETILAMAAQNQFKKSFRNSKSTQGFKNFQHKNGSKIINY